MLEYIIKDNVTAGLLKKAKKAGDLSPVMRSFARDVLSPLKGQSWRSSGLHEKSGELRDAVQVWSGKRSAGITLRTEPGHDLIIAKATTHQSGARKDSFRNQKKLAYRVKGYTTRGGRNVKGYAKRRVVSPWGNIPKRQFFPLEGAIEKDRLILSQLLQRYFEG
jgi:hypothetical protein